MNREDRAAARVRAAAWAAVLVLGGVACSEDSVPLTIRNLDRPTAVAFGCYGEYRVNGGDTSAEGTVTRSAQPVGSCAQHATGTPPEGQEGLTDSPRLYGFLLQDSRGTVAVVDSETQSVLDSDPLTPGKNAIPIGTLPVGLVGDHSGCFLVSASAASCDLASMDVSSALDLRAAAGIARVNITSSDGVLMRAKPRALVGRPEPDNKVSPAPEPEPIGLECPARPRGLVYVAYPQCHLIAAVDADSGQIQAGVQFAEDGSATVTDGAVSCPDECGDGSISPTLALGGPDLDAGPPDAGPVDAGPVDAGPPPPDAGPPTIDDMAPRPVALHQGKDGRLYVGAENSPIVTVIGLDEAGGFADVSSVQLDGAVGVTSLALSGEVINGGANGAPGGDGGTSRFLYAVGTDRTVRVVKVDGTEMEECDTQVDPRLIHAETDAQLLPCFPIGDPRTPARRPGAISPGIQMPGDQAPLDVAFAAIVPEAAPEEPAPLALSGTFAFVTTSQGNVYVVNVDDDVYPDAEQPDDPAAVSMTLALPHQIRDRGTGRSEVATSCGTPSTDPSLLGPRVDTGPSRTFATERIAQEKLHLMPWVHQVSCVGTDDQKSATSELSFTAPVADRELAFPDWRSVLNETWSLVFEGVLSRDGFIQDVDGPSIRSGGIGVDGFTLTLNDPSEAFCQLGVEPLDEVQLLGCDPTLGDGQCGLGETCYVHPETPSVITTGVCLPADRADSLATPCRDFLTTRRQFSASEVFADHVVLVPRRRVLRTSPLDGCTSDEQCETMAQVDEALGDPTHPVAIRPAPTGYDWVCTQDPSRPPAPDRCLMACETTDDCEEGNACLAGFCNEGVPPGPECVQAVQRYQVRASDAFVAVGTISGYLHNRVRGADGQCVADPDASPLQVGRIPLRAPPCVESDDPIRDVSPNPCSHLVDQTEAVTPFEDQDGQCVAQDDAVVDRPQIPALQLQNPSMRFNLVDVATTGDLVCNGDRAGDLPLFSAAYPGYEIDVPIIGGFIPLFVQFAATPTFPLRIAPAPDGRLWVLDQGDGGGAAGRVFTLVPNAPASDFFGTVIIQ